MHTNKITSERITSLYLQHIEDINKNGVQLNAVIEVNPDALNIAKAMDEERKKGKVRGPLHGIPVLIKDNINTGDKMMTTAGAAALIGNVAKGDAFIITKLREAGAVLLGQNQFKRMGKLSFHSLNQWLEQPRRANQMSLYFGSESLWFQRRNRRRCSGKFVHRWHRYRNGWFYRFAIISEWFGGYQANGGFMEPERHHSYLCHARHRWANGAYRKGRSHFVRRTYRR